MFPGFLPSGFFHEVLSHENEYFERAAPLALLDKQREARILAHLAGLLMECHRSIRFPGNNSITRGVLDSE